MKNIVVILTGLICIGFILNGNIDFIFHTDLNKFATVFVIGLIIVLYISTFKFTSKKTK
jgi:hypothetical protein